MEPSWKQAVRLSFWIQLDHISEETARQFVDCLLNYGFLPDKYGDDDPPRRKFDPKSTDGFVKLWLKRPKQMSIQRLGRLGFQAILHLNPQLGPGPHLLSFGVHDEYFKIPGNTEKFLEFSEKLYSIVKPVLGDIGHVDDRRNKTVIERRIQVGNREVSTEDHLPAHPAIGLFGVYWANLFGRVYVDFFSEDKLASTPAYQKKVLQDGGYLILTSKSPLDYQSLETKRIEVVLMQHLGEDAFFDKNNPDRVLKTPFGPASGYGAIGTNGPEKLSSVVQCPKCRESNKITKVRDDPVNNLVGFRCLKCGAVWAVEKSLIH